MNWISKKKTPARIIAISNPPINTAHISSDNPGKNDPLFDSIWLSSCSIKFSSL
jgi:hypothetical protein